MFYSKINNFKDRSTLADMRPVKIIVCPQVKRNEMFTKTLYCYSCITIKCIATFLCVCKLTRIVFEHSAELDFLLFDYKFILCFNLKEHFDIYAVLNVWIHCSTVSKYYTIIDIYFQKLPWYFGIRLLQRIYTWERGWHRFKILLSYIIELPLHIYLK